MSRQMSVEGDGLRDRRSLLYKKFVALIGSIETLPGSHWFLPTLDRRDGNGRSLSLGSVKKKLETRKYFTKADLEEDVKFLFAAAVGDRHDDEGEGGDEENDIRVAAASCSKVFTEAYKEISENVTYSGGMNSSTSGGGGGSGSGGGGGGGDTKKESQQNPKLTASGKKRGPPFKKDRVNGGNPGSKSDSNRDINARKNVDELRHRLSEEMETLRELNEKVEILRNSNVDGSVLSHLLSLVSEMEGQHKLVQELALAEENRLIYKAKIEYKKQEAKALELQRIREEKEREAAALIEGMKCRAEEEGEGEEEDEGEGEGDEEEEEERFPSSTYNVVLYLSGRPVLLGQRGKGVFWDEQVEEDEEEEHEKDDEAGEGVVNIIYNTGGENSVVKKVKRKKKLIVALKAKIAKKSKKQDVNSMLYVNNFKPSLARSMIPRHLVNTLSLPEKEAMLLTFLLDYLKECGALNPKPDDFKVVLEAKKESSGGFETLYFNKEGRKFRSRAELARFLKLPNAPVTKRIAGAAAKKNKTQGIIEAKAKIKKELEAKAAQKAHEKELKKLAAITILTMSSKEKLLSESSSSGSGVGTGEDVAVGVPGMDDIIVDDKAHANEASYNRKAQSELKNLQSIRARLERALVREKEKREQVRYPIEDILLEFEPPAEPPLPPRPQAEGQGLPLHSASSSVEGSTESWCHIGQRVWHNKYGGGEVCSISFPWSWVKFDNPKVMKKAKSKAVLLEYLLDHDPKLGDEVHDSDNGGDDQLLEQSVEIEGDTEDSNLDNKSRGEKDNSSMVTVECLSPKITENLFSSLGCLNAFGRHPDYFQEPSILTPWIKCFNKQTKLASTNNDENLETPIGSVDVDTFLKSIMSNGEWSSSAHECLLKMLFGCDFSDAAWVADSVFEDIERNYAKKLHSKEEGDDERSEEDQDEKSVWKTEGSPYVGLAVTRSVFEEDSMTNDSPSSSSPQFEKVKGVIVGWLPEEESDFIDSEGNPAALYRVEYTSGSLEGDGEDLEEKELWASLPPLEVEGLKKAQIAATKERRKRKPSSMEEEDNKQCTKKSRKSKETASMKGKSSQEGIQDLEEDMFEEDMEERDGSIDRRGNSIKTKHGRKPKPSKKVLLANESSSSPSTKVKTGKRYDEKLSKFLTLHSIKQSEIRSYEKPTAAEVTPASWKNLSLALAVGYLRLWEHQSVIFSYELNLKKKEEQEAEQAEFEEKSQLQCSESPSHSSSDVNSGGERRKDVSMEEEEKKVIYDKNFDREDKDGEVLASLSKLASYDEATTEDKINILYILTYASCETDIASSIFMLQIEDRIALEGNWLLEDRDMKKAKKKEQMKVYVLARKRIAARKRSDDGDCWKLLSDYDCVQNEDDDNEDNDDYGDGDGDDDEETKNEKPRKRRGRKSSIEKELEVQEKEIDDVKQSELNTEKKKEEEEQDVDPLVCAACQGEGTRHTCAEGIALRETRKLEMKSVAPYFVQQEVQKMMEAEACGGDMREPFFIYDDKFIDILKLEKEREAKVEHSPSDEGHVDTASNMVVEESADKFPTAKPASSDADIANSSTNQSNLEDKQTENMSESPTSSKAADSDMTITSSITSVDTTEAKESVDTTEAKESVDTTEAKESVGAVMEDNVESSTSVPSEGAVVVTNDVAISPVPVILKGGLKIRPVKKRVMYNPPVENITFKKSKDNGSEEESSGSKPMSDEEGEEEEEDEEEEQPQVEVDQVVHIESPPSPQEDIKEEIEPMELETVKERERRESIEFMQNALKSGDIVDLELALEKGRELEFEGLVTKEHVLIDENYSKVKLGLIEGAKWVTELQRDVYVALRTNSEMKEERKTMVSRRVEASRLTPSRVFPLGVDRYGTYYYSYLSDPVKSRIWMQEAPWALKNSDKRVSPRARGKEDDSMVDDSSNDQVEIKERESQGVFGSASMSWISSLDAISDLAKSLDRRGINEKQLQDALLAHLEVLCHPDA